MKSVNMKPPSILQLEVTKNCNNACIMCHKGQMESGQDFDRTDISNRIVEQVKPVYPYLKRAMLFGDGEPMLYKGFWDIISDIRKASSECCIDFINNGSLMNEVNIKNCLKFEVSYIALSMGGATANTHEHIRKLSNFDRVVQNYKKLRDIKLKHRTKSPYVGALIVVMKSNYKELPKFVELCNELGFISVECQQLFITHPSMNCEIIQPEKAEAYIQEASKKAKELGIRFSHYPLNNTSYFIECDISRLDMNDRYPSFIANSVRRDNYGYCLYQQPWNEIYVLHDGKVVPDCHWWKSDIAPKFNYCGVLDKNTNILDIWNGEIYNEIRQLITKGEIIPQCRGCGLAGGIVEKYRCSKTDHTNPHQEYNFVKLSVKDEILEKIKKISSTDTEKRILYLTHQESSSFYGRV